MDVEWFKKKMHIFTYKMLIVCVVYGIILTNSIYNRIDGVWNGTYRLEGDWELSIGRGAIRYLDWLHYGVSVHPTTDIITLAFFVLGTFFLVSILEIREGSVWDYLVSMLFLTNVIVSTSLSYLFTSMIYGISFMLSMMAVWFIKRATDGYESMNNRKLFPNKYSLFYLIGAGTAVVLMLNLYQAYLGCIGITAIFYFLLVLYRKEYKRILPLFIYGIMVLGGGAIAYKIVLKVERARYAVGIADYNGANSVSVNTITSNIGATVVRTYSEFWKYAIIDGGHLWNRLPGAFLGVILCVLAVSSLVLEIFKNRKVVDAIAFTVFLLLSPMMVNIVMIIVPGSAFEIQQTAPNAMVMPLLVGFLFKEFQDYFSDNGNGAANVGGKVQRIWKKKIPGAVLGVLTAVLIWGSCWQSIIDQEAMRQGAVALKSMEQEKVTEMQRKGLLGSDRSYAFIGVPIGNPLCYVNSIYYDSNDYARVAGNYWDSYITSWTWRGNMTNYMGINIPMCDDDTYVNLMNDERVMQMPIFPEEGSIAEIDGVVVVHVSE